MLHSCGGVIDFPRARYPLAVVAAHTRSKRREKRKKTNGTAITGRTAKRDLSKIVHFTPPAGDVRPVSRDRCPPPPTEVYAYEQSVRARALKSRGFPFCLSSYSRTAVGYNSVFSIFFSAVGGARREKKNVKNKQIYTPKRTRPHDILPGFAARKLCAEHPRGNPNSTIAKYTIYIRVVMHGGGLRGPNDVFADGRRHIKFEPSFFKSRGRV